MKTKIYIIGAIPLGIIVYLILSVDASDRIVQLEQNISERSQEWKQEAEIAKRGNIAEERMAALNRQNNIDRLELQSLTGKQ